MLRLFLILYLGSSVVFSATSEQHCRAVEQDVRIGRLNARTMYSIDNLIHISTGIMYFRGHGKKAIQIKSEWDQTYREQYRAFIYSRDIGDHPSQILSSWLDTTVTTMELTLGLEFCKLSHISDLRVFNSTPKIVFRPCTFEMDAVPGERIDEYRRHFAQGSVYYGLIPVVTYWSAYLGCSIGFPEFIYACGVAGDSAEKMMAQFVAPGLSDFVYKKSCGGTYAERTF